MGVPLPDDSPLGLGHEALRGWAVLLLAVCGVAALLIALRGVPSPRRRRMPAWLAVTLVALLVRGLASVVQDGGVYDVLVAYRLIGENLFHGVDIWSGQTDSLATYPPPVYAWWGTAALIPADHPHVFAALVRLPFWFADAAIAPVLLRAVGGDLGRRAAWVYALCPVAIAVPTLHGQIDPVVALLLLLAVISVARRPAVAGLGAGAAIAIKQWPVFFLLPMLATLAPRRLARFASALALPPLAGFGAYALLRPADAWRGLVFVSTYKPHRQGLGTSLLFADKVPSGEIVITNLGAVLVGAVLGVLMVRAGRSLAEAMALDMLVLVALSPTVSDQYLMWAFPFLLLAGRVRTAALLGLGLLPAVAGLDLWTSQNDGATPRGVLAVATLCCLAAAASLLRRPRPVTFPAGAKATAPAPA
jgi:Glycosyltransferase family 87